MAPRSKKRKGPSKAPPAGPAAKGEKHASKSSKATDPLPVANEMTPTLDRDASPAAGISAEPFDIRQSMDQILDWVYHTYTIIEDTELLEARIQSHEIRLRMLDRRIETQENRLRKTHQAVIASRLASSACLPQTATGGQDLSVLSDPSIDVVSYELEESADLAALHSFACRHLHWARALEEHEADLFRSGLAAAEKKIFAFFDNITHLLDTLAISLSPQPDNQSDTRLPTTPLDLPLYFDEKATTIRLINGINRLAKKVTRKLGEVDRKRAMLALLESTFERAVDDVAAAGAALDDLKEDRILFPTRVQEKLNVYFYRGDSDGEDPKPASPSSRTSRMHGPLRAGIQEKLDITNKLDDEMEQYMSELQDASDRQLRVESAIKDCQRQINDAQAVIDSFPAKIRWWLKEPESEKVISALGCLKAEAEAFESSQHPTADEHA